MSLTEQLQQRIMELEDQFPAWQVWIVHRYIGGDQWCAKHRTVEKVWRYADKPEDLADDLQEWEDEHARHTSASEA